jgi:hypothetical protein
MESQHVLLRQSIVGLASEATVRACEMTRNHKHTEYLKAGWLLQGLRNQATPEAAVAVYEELNLSLGQGEAHLYGHHTSGT